MYRIKMKSPARLFLAIGLSLLFSCKNDRPENHEAALPHNNMESGSELTESETAQLAHAEGKSVALISPAGLEEMLLENEAGLTVVNFWKLGCADCFEMQNHLQAIRQNVGGEKLHIISLNMDAQPETEKVKLAIRTAGVASPAFQLLENSDLLSLGITPGWEGGFPAIAILSGGEMRGFYEGAFSEPELVAVLNPFFMMAGE